MSCGFGEKVFIGFFRQSRKAGRCPADRAVYLGIHGIVKACRSLTCRCNESSSTRKANARHGSDHPKQFSVTRAQPNFQALLDAAPDAMVGVDPQGKIVMAN